METVSNPLIDSKHKKSTRKIPDEIRSFYNNVYHRDVRVTGHVPVHFRRLARRLGPWGGKQLLDVGSGTGQWLVAAARKGAIPVGVDISQAAIDACRQLLPQAELYCGTAESLPFDDNRFDVVSCLGSLEHFLDPERALHEMARVAKPTALLLLLVPNADFLPRRLGLYHGTWQVEAHEEVRTLAEWEVLFNTAGLRVTRRWKDLHILSWSWIRRGRWYSWPIRAVQALALPLWPLSWQYQVYHLCEIR